ncbi:MAG: DNA mismatch repair protein MutS [Clostridiales bacterium]|uniref:DNA mismatch repair protein MutS n=1 Tax=Provencibacterium massiliense TaxID=1841868 RepID=UPI0009A7C805|nr:DNA mismatch repair protein MutS [Provencibacterium massiliense]PWM39890.1 MAG: DNA mismatch repair protein MutS [Clostridiales bacterium]RGB68688.1 DNA mismatch repair protein MutS [Harryflintia acetispora]
MQTQNLSPMMQQYMAIKEKCKDKILFYRLGDFYEMFFDDALTASRELELTLTGRDCGLEERAPMCGVPYHSCEAYIARLIEKGYNVAICEQMEDPKAAKGLVKRDVIRVVTPGTILETNMLEEGKNNFIASLYAGKGGCGCAFADISTGEVRACQVEGDVQRLKSELGRFSPSEVLLGGELAGGGSLEDGLRAFLKERLGCVVSGFDFSSVTQRECAEVLPAQFGAQNLELLSLADKPQLQIALCALLRYLGETQQRGLECLNTLDLYSGEDYMNLDLTACRNLELIRTLRAGEKRGSLLWVLDHTHTAMGKRLLRQWVEKPLLSPTRISKRLNAVGELYDNTMLLGECEEALSDVFDLERLMSRIVYGNASPRELKSLEYTARRLPQLRGLLGECRAQYLRDIYRDLDTLDDVADLVGRAVSDEPPIALKDGGVIKAGFDQNLDELRSLVSGAKGFIAGIEAGERERTGIKNLKIGYNRVFGYYIEVTKSYLELVPETYIRKQTLANCERYITDELKELENKIFTATEQIERVEQELYQRVRGEVCKNLSRIQRSAGLVARLDVFCSFARVSLSGGYCRPQVDLSGTIEIKEGRHPVVELMVKSTPFVSNDVYLDMNQNRIAIITGPNMAGKSTYMRMTALIVLMAQIGCFVPAKSANLSIVDGIYTRVGASDDLTTGQSTFMVEMSEVAEILKSATKNSLIILDEIGRGTSTFDGMSIARAVVEYIADKRRLGAKTMFATHYHELTALEEDLEGVKNYNIAVKRQGEDVIFLRRIVPGGADDSYGIYVSKLAGIPDPVIQRAGVILRSLEAGDAPSSHKRKRPAEPEADQIVIRQSDDSEIVRRLREIDLNNLTPLAAMNVLGELKSLI